MEHVVFYTENPGAPEFRRVDGLEEAVRFVESLRNERGIAEVSVHALTPVPVSFRTYYRVEVGGADVERPVDDVQATAQPVESAEEAEVAPAPEVESAEVAEVASAEVTALENAALEAAALEAVSFEAISFQVAEPEVDEFEADFAVPSLEVPSLEVPSFEDDSIASLAVLPPPVESDQVFEFVGPDDEFAAPVEDVVESDGEQVDEFESLTSYEPLVPPIRQESDAERSLGYFAK